MARILVVDDESNIRMMIRLTLEQAGHEIVVAEDGFRGLQAFGDGSNFDLVLLDQRMPGMEGVEVLREMKSRSPGSRIIMITAFGTIDLAVDAMKAGATDFLRKPFTTEILRGAVLGVLNPALEEPDMAQTVTEPVRQKTIQNPILYGLMTINGFHIESDPKAAVMDADDLHHIFSVRHPGGEVKPCTIILAGHFISELKATADLDLLPRDNRFWHALCEHVLSNYLYQNADYPPELVVRVETIDRSTRNWVKAAVKSALGA